MRVMQLTTNLQFGGAEKVIVHLARALAGRGVECAVAALHGEPEGPSWTRRLLESAGLEVFNAGMERRHMVWRILPLRRHLLQWRPDVLHCHLFHGNVCGTIARMTGLRCRIIWTHHTVERRFRPVRKCFYRVLSRWPDCKVFVSEAVRRYHRSLTGPARREEVIHDGIDLAPMLAIRREPRGRAPVVFGALGRLRPEKGYPDLLAAFAELAGAHEGVRLRIAGEGPQRGELAAMIRRLGLGGRVELAGFVRDVAGFLAGVDVLVHPSRGEGFGLALLEGMAAGLPCIASRVDALPEVGGELVRWVPPGDREALSRAMAQCLSGAPSPDRIRRQRRAAARFGVDAMADRYLELYRSLLHGGG